MLEGGDGFGRRKLVQRTAAERAAIVAESYATVKAVAKLALPEQMDAASAIAACA